MSREHNNQEETKKEKEKAMINNNKRKVHERKNLDYQILMIIKYE